MKMLSFEKITEKSTHWHIEVGTHWHIEESTHWHIEEIIV